MQITVTARFVWLEMSLQDDPSLSLNEINYIYVIDCVYLIFLVRAICGRPRPEICPLPGRLRWTLLPKERYGNWLCFGQPQTMLRKRRLITRQTVIPVWKWSIYWDWQTGFGIHRD